MQIIHCSWPWPGNCVYITQTSYFVILQGLYPAGTFTLMKWIKTLCGIDSRSYIKLWRHWALLCSVILIPWRQLQSVKQGKQGKWWNYELLAEALVWHPMYIWSLQETHACSEEVDCFSLHCSKLCPDHLICLSGVSCHLPVYLLQLYRESSIHVCHFNRESRVQ